jgi:hypothetical protein
MLKNNNKKEKRNSKHHEGSLNTAKTEYRKKRFRIEKTEKMIKNKKIEKRKILTEKNINKKIL